MPACSHEIIKETLCIKRFAGFMAFLFVVFFKVWK